MLQAIHYIASIDIVLKLYIIKLCQFIKLSYLGLLSAEYKLQQN